MKLDELNNQGKHYFNVLPPQEVKPNSSRMIATILRAQADSQGTEPDAKDQGSSKRREKNTDVARNIVLKSKKLLKGNRNSDREFELVTDKNRTAREDGTGGVYR